MEIRQIGEVLREQELNIQPGVTQEQQNSLINYKKRSDLQDQDKAVIRLKYSSPQIGMLDSGTQELWADALLLKIHVITGWVIPEAALLNILTDQFRKKLIENYAHLNVDEIEFAFRNGGTIIQDWGKAMNLSLIDSVLIPYSNQRFNLSAQEERQKSEPPPQRLYTQEEVDNEHRADVEAFYQRCRNGITPYAIPQYFTPILEKDGLLQPGENVAEYLTRKLNSGAENIYVKTD